jgi:GT2 family glycosyltransferase
MRSEYSLVVVAWECAGYLQRLIESMNAHLDGTQELIVVDNASSDDPEPVARQWKGPQTFVGLNDNIGFGAATNLGVERARNDAIVMINPDTELIDSGLDRLAAAALELKGLVGPRVLNPDRSIQPSASGPEVGTWPWIRAVLPGAISPVAIRRYTEPYRLERPVRVTWLTGACIGGPRAELVALGPFDPTLHMYGEDVDLGLRAAAAGLSSYFLPDRCSVIHHGAGSSTVAYGSADGWRPEGTSNWRAVLRRRYGPGTARRAWWALRLNLGLRLTAKRVLGRAEERDVAAYQAVAQARDANILPANPAPPGAI